MNNRLPVAPTLWAKQAQSIMADAYVESLLWSSSVIGLDEQPYNADEYHHSDALQESSYNDCVDFYQTNSEIIELYIEQMVESGMSERDAFAQLGHDFALTRNHHGAGFWDRGLGDLGINLTDIAQSYGSVDVYLGDDELIHI